MDRKLRGSRLWVKIFYQNVLMFEVTQRNEKIFKSCGSVFRPSLFC